MNIKNLWDKYRDILPYGVFGVLTTIVNIGTYWFFAHPVGGSVMVSTVLAWIASVLFAYLTNRKWVFHSEARTGKEVGKEIVSFFSCRLATGVLDWVCMFVFVDLCGWNDVLIKCVANVLVIVLNYVASKLVIFRHKGGMNEKSRKCRKKRICGMDLCVCGFCVLPCLGAGGTV